MLFKSKAWSTRLSDWTQIISPHLCIFCEEEAPLYNNPAVCEPCMQVQWTETRCRRCQKTCHEHELSKPRCHKCQSISYPFIRFISLGAYRDSLRQAILLTKFYQDPLALRFIQNMATSIELPEEPEASWTYVPSNPKRIKERGGKAQHLPQMFKKLAKSHRKKFTILLKKDAHCKPQIELNEKERRKGLDASLHYCGPNQAPQTVFLFDDVWSTGTTLNSAARVLKERGVENIYVISLAFNDLTPAKSKVEARLKA